jgi:hypothetical protein
MLGLAVLLGLGNWVGLLERPPAVNPPARFDAHLQDIGAVVLRRANYSYSVIPGGAFTQPELQRAISRDAVVADHYSDVNASTMRPEILKADRMAYVSYRLGDRVYWTTKKVRIRGGETILTNGRQEIRARCGNCISLEPLMPTSADEPDIMQLDALSDTGPMPLEALNDPSPMLVAFPLNPWGRLALGAPVGVEPQFGLPVFPFPSGFPGTPVVGATGDTDIGSLVPGALPDVDAGVGVDTTPPGSGTPPGGITPPGGVMPPLPTGPNGPGFSGGAPFLPTPPDLLAEPTPAVTPRALPVDATAVPEPATLLLLGGGVAALIARRWRANKS